MVFWKFELRFFLIGIKIDKFIIFEKLNDYVIFKVVGSSSSVSAAADGERAEKKRIALIELRFPIDRTKRIFVQKKVYKEVGIFELFFLYLFNPLK